MRISFCWQSRRTIPTAFTRWDTTACFAPPTAPRTWVRQGAPPGGGQIGALLPLSGGSLLAGTTTGLFRLSGGSWAAVELAGSRRPVERLQSSGGALVAAVTSAGAFRSENGGRSWTACGQPATGAVWYGLALDSAHSGGSLAATAQGLFRSTDGCASWTLVRSGLDQATVSAVMFLPRSTGQAIVTQFDRIFHSTDGGISWHPLDGEARSGSYPSALLVLPEAPQRLFALFPRRGILFFSIDLNQPKSIGGF